MQNVEPWSSYCFLLRGSSIEVLIFFFLIFFEQVPFDVIARLRTGFETRGEKNLMPYYWTINISWRIWERAINIACYRIGSCGVWGQWLQMEIVSRNLDGNGLSLCVCWWICNACARRWGICTNRCANMMYEMSGRPGWVYVSLLWYCLFMLIQPFE